MKKIYKNTEIFKKILGIVTKTISKKKKIEISYTNKESDFSNNIVNIKEPPLSISKKNISEVRGNADSVGSQIRYHNPEIHKKYVKEKSRASKIFNNLEKSRCESLGSYDFNGIKKKYY